MTNMQTIIDVANHAAVQSDRWLMVFLLFCGLLSTGLVARYVIRDRDRLIDTLGDHADRQIATTEKVAGVVATNTAALEKFSGEFQRLRDNCGKALVLFLLSVLPAGLLSGCALSSPTMTREVLTGTNVTERVTLKLRSYAIWPATIEAARVKASAGKTLGFGVSDVTMDAGGTNVSATVDSLTRLFQALPK